MGKIAIFVEGQTEGMFAVQLLKEIVGRHNILIKEEKLRGQPNSDRAYYILSASIRDTGYPCYALVVNCSGGGERVVSVIRENYDTLVANGFQAIIGLRDVYPDVTYEELPQLREGLKKYLKANPIGVVFVLAVMEIEAWFIAEYTHFARVNHQLTMARIRGKVGFDPSRDDVGLRGHPARDLDQIYSLVGWRYKKHQMEVRRTLNLLDFGQIYLVLGERILDLKNLNDSIDQFFSR